MNPTAVDPGALLALPQWSPEEVAYLQRAARRDPDLYQALSETADRLEDRVRHGENGTARRQLAAARAILGHLEEAEEALQDLPDDVITLFIRGLCAREHGRRREAIRFFQQARDLGWPDPSARFEIIETHLELDELDEAERLAADLPSDSAEAHYVRGWLLARRGDPEGAIAAFRQALETDPHCREARFRLAYLLDLIGADDEARQQYETLATSVPVHINALINLAVLYEDAGLLDQAERCLRQVLEINPNHQRARMYLKDVLSAREMFYDEDAFRATEQRNAILDTPLAEFELSARSRNCLEKMNIHTLGDLLRMTDEELLAYKNFGETSLKEIRDVITAKATQLGVTEEELRRQALARPPRYVPPGDPAILARPVSELQLSVRARKCLQRLNIKSIGELASKTEAELLGIKNFGQTSLNEIKQRLAELGLSLRRID